MARLMPESYGIFAPNANSISALSRQQLAPTATRWGVDNRTVSMRVTTGALQRDTWSIVSAESDANPYLAVAAILAGAHYGSSTRLIRDARHR